MGTLKELKKISQQDPAGNKFQGYVRDSLAALNAPFLQGRFLTEVISEVETDLIQLTGSAKTYNHKLGRPIQGFLVLDKRGNQNIWRVVAGEDSSLQVTLQAGGNVRAKVWVF
jgi:hypothetical protein